jgi:hypothetical protein
LRIFEEVAETAVLSLAKKCFGCISTDALPGEHSNLFGPRQTLKMKNKGLAPLFEEGAKRRKIAFAEPIYGPTGYPNLWRIDREELHHEFIDRVPVTASTTLLIQSVDKKRLPSQHGGRRVQKRACLNKPRLLGSGSFSEEMSFAGARIAEQYDVRLIGKVRERSRCRILRPVGHNVRLAYCSGHPNQLTIVERAKLAAPAARVKDDKQSVK